MSNVCCKFRLLLSCYVLKIDNKIRLTNKLKFIKHIIQIVKNFKTIMFKLLVIKYVIKIKIIFQVRYSNLLYCHSKIRFTNDLQHSVEKYR